MILFAVYVFVGLMLWLMGEDSHTVWAEYAAIGVMLMAVVSYYYITVGKVV